MRHAILATCLAASLAAPAAAQSIALPQPDYAVSGDTPLTGTRASVARELPRFGFGDIDVRRLSSGQVAHIHGLVYSGRSDGDIRGHISATLRRGLLQRGVDRVTRR